MPSSSSSSSWWWAAAPPRRFLRVLPAAALLVPPLWCARDRLGGFCRVRGASMEPHLRDGDVLWVRRADAGTLLEALRAALVGDGNGESNADREERRRVARHEALQGITHHVGLFSARPPTVAAGDLVVYRNPTRLRRDELLVKRCVGVGGQWIRLQEEHPPPPPDPYGKNQQAHHHQQYQYRLQALPPYTLYVEGSNRAKSVDDSRTHGPLSKNLVVGIAEYTVWPPSRWQRLRRTPQTVPDGDGREAPRAVWY